MYRDGENPVGGVEGVLNSVPVVAINVHVGDSHALLKKAVNGYHRVVEYAEAVGVVGHGVMQSAGYVEGGVRLARYERFGGHDGRASGERGGLVDAGIVGVVARAEVEGGGGDARARRAYRLDAVDIFRRVKPAEFGLGGLPSAFHPGSVAVERAVGIQQVAGVPESRGASLGACR